MTREALEKGNKIIPEIEKAQEEIAKWEQAKEFYSVEILHKSYRATPDMPPQAFQDIRRMMLQYWKDVLHYQETELASL